MVVVDSTVWVDYFNGHQNPATQWLDANMGQEVIALIDVILCEVLQGVRDEKQFAVVSRQLSDFEVLPSGGKEMAVEVAGNFRELRKRGFTVRKTLDCWIATFCLREGHRLLHRDRDFDPFENELGLQVV